MVLIGAAAFQQNASEPRAWAADVATSNSDPLSPPALVAQSIAPALLWVGLLIAVLLVGGYAIILLRNRYLGDENDSTEPSPLTLDGLRQLHAAGKLSDEEFQQARAAIISSVRTRQDDADDPAAPLRPRQTPGEQPDKARG